MSQPEALVIVESPAKAKTISKYLGKKYMVKASMGHVRDLPKSQMGVDVDNQFQPKYITIRGKGNILKDLKDSSKKVKRVFLAADPDREGEAIAWHLAHVLELPDETGVFGGRPGSGRRGHCLAFGPCARIAGRRAVPGRVSRNYERGRQRGVQTSAAD